jgi:predicted metal-binding protein
MIGRVLALYECSGCTGRMGADAWNKLSKAEQGAASAAIEAGIAESISLED